MTRRDFFYKWLFYCAAALFCLFIQQALLNRLPLWNGIHPFILPLIPVMAAMLEHDQYSIFFAMIFGLLCDFLLPGVIPCFYLLVFLSSALLTRLIAARVMLPGFLCAFICSVLALVLTDLVLILLLNYSIDFTAAGALTLAGRELLLSLPFSLLIYPLFRRIRQLFRSE